MYLIKIDNRDVYCSGTQNVSGFMFIYLFIILVYSLLCYTFFYIFGSFFNALGGGVPPPPLWRKAHWYCFLRNPTKIQSFIYLSEMEFSRNSEMIFLLQ